ncbi:hypothetical protein BS17DRAFT_776661 [Gyrodon lividus]|nr:hypothetical protein BS17DRAFT_776661 [Gyrodon lividus]
MDRFVNSLMSLPPNSKSYSPPPPFPSPDSTTHNAHLPDPRTSLSGLESPPPENGLKALLGVSGPVPKWIPVTLLAFSSVAMVLPLVMLRRYKTSSGHIHVDVQRKCSSSISATVPPRRGSRRGVGPGSVVGNSRLEVPPTTISTSPSTPPPRIRLQRHTRPYSPTLAPPSSPSLVKPRPTPLRKIPIEPPSEEDRFNAPLHSLKAFTIATALVMSSAAASVAGVGAYLGVRDVRSFFSFFHC